MKKYICCLLSVWLACAPVCARDGLKVIYDGTEVDFGDQKPIVLDSRTMIPIRGLFEKMGYSVDWDADTKTVTLRNLYDNIRVTVGADNIYKNNESIETDVPATIINGRTMLPLRVIGEASGASMAWDAETKTVSVSSAAKIAEKTETTVDDYVRLFTGLTSKLGGVDELIKELNSVTERNLNEKYSALKNKIAQETELVAYVKSGLESLEPPEELRENHAYALKALDNLSFVLKSLDGLLNDDVDHSSVKDEIDRLLDESRENNKQVSNYLRNNTLFGE